MNRSSEDSRLWVHSKGCPQILQSLQTPQTKAFKTMLTSEVIFRGDVRLVSLDDDVRHLSDQKAWGGPCVWIRFFG